MKYYVKSFIKGFLEPITKRLRYSITYGGVSVKLKGGLDFLGSKRFDKEEQFLCKLDLKGKIVFDIGSHIGILTIYFAKKCVGGRVIAFEPNPETYLKLQSNVRFNRLNNVEILNMGIGSKKELKTLATRRYYPGSGSMEDVIKTDIFREKYKIFEVKVDTLDSCIQNEGLPKPDLVKIDIEGMEYSALLGMTKTLSEYKPLLYIEIHGSSEKNKTDTIQKIVKLIDSKNYSILHVESKQKIHNENFWIAKKGHIFCN